MTRQSYLRRRPLPASNRQRGKQGPPQLGFLLLENKVRDGERMLVDYDRNSRKLVFNPKPSPVGPGRG